MGKMRRKMTLYVDVTQLIHWEGKLTGIPRVMHELAIRFNDEPNVKYVSWVKQIKAYCEVDFSESVLKRGGIRYVLQDALPSQQEADSNAVSVPAYHVLAKRVANKLINGTKYIHPRLPDIIRDRAIQGRAAKYKKVQLGGGDSVFIPWGEWWDKNFLTMLVEAHSNGAKISTFIHDVGPMVAPHLTGNSASLADYCATVVPVCDEVVVNSHFTRDTLVKWLKDNGHTIPPVSVVRLGDDFKHKKPERPSFEQFIASGVKGQDYILTVGTVELKKNHIFYYYVYKLARERGIDLPPLVIAGRKGWGTDTNITIMQTDPELKDKFIFSFDTSDEELAWLYEHSLFAVFASMYEGWGLPLAESLFYGVPVISASSTSLLEVGGGMIDRFTQASTDECLSAIQRMMNVDYRKEKRAQAGTYVPATWDDCYKEIAMLLKKGDML